MDELRFGSTIYPFQEWLTERVTMDDSGTFIATYPRVNNLPPGRGASAKLAMDERDVLFHCNFQRLYRMRPFEMTPEDKTLWAAFAQVVDIDAYERQNPVAMRQTGRVKLVGKSGVEIQWVGGGLDAIPFIKGPAKLAALREGDWVEGVVARHRQTYELVSLLCVDHCRAPDEAMQVFLLPHSSEEVREKAIEKS